MRRTNSPIGNRYDGNFSLWVDGSYTLCNRLPSFGCRQTPFERLGSNENTHVPIFLLGRV
jgi:hypothetical protein